jgi:hypothetical protein
MTSVAVWLPELPPLEESYMRTSILTLTWKRGMWLTILFFTALSTAFALQHYEKNFETYTWLVLFIPLVISSGGNSGDVMRVLDRLLPHHIDHVIVRDDPQNSMFVIHHGDGQQVITGDFRCDQFLIVQHVDRGHVGLHQFA